MKPSRKVERVQTGIRIERRILNVLKSMAAVYDISVGDLMEGIVLHAFEGKAPFDAAAREKIDVLRKVYGLDLTAKDAHLLTEQTRRSRKRG